MKSFPKNKHAVWLRRAQILLSFIIMIGFVSVFYLEVSNSSAWGEFNARVIGREFENSKRAIENTTTEGELEAWISSREEHVDGELAASGLSIKRDQKAHVHWAHDHESGKSKSQDALLKRTPISIVYIHGFSAGPLEFEPTLSLIAKKLGANLFVARLKAHGLQDAKGVSSGEEFANVRARDWALDVEEAVAIGRRIGERPVFIGLSTGATLLLEHFARHAKSEAGAGSEGVSEVASKEKPESLVLLSPNYEPQAFGTFLLEGFGASFFAHRIIGDYTGFDTSNDLHRNRWTWRYRVEGLIPMMQLVSRVRSLDLHAITQPVLTVYTPYDDVVRIDKILERSSSFTGKSKLIGWEGTRHHQMASAAFDPDKIEELSDLILGWVRVVVAQ